MKYNDYLTQTLVFLTGTELKKKTPNREGELTQIFYKRTINENSPVLYYLLCLALRTNIFFDANQI